MAKEKRILKALYQLVQDKETQVGHLLDAALISEQTPGLSLGEIEQEIRDLDFKKLVVMERGPNNELYCTLTAEGLQEAQQAAK